MIRVVLYAEGPTELAGEEGTLPRPTDPLLDRHLGPAHLLLRRSLSFALEIPADRVRFDSPLLTRARRAKGSDLLNRLRLRQLLTWPDIRKRPDLAVVMLDQNGDRQRKKHLIDLTDGLPVCRVFAIPVKEFEAWLIADRQTLTSLLGGGVRVPATPERLEVRRAKELFAELCGQLEGTADPHRIRREIGLNCNLETLRRRCRSFERFLADLREIRDRLPSE